MNFLPTDSSGQHVQHPIICAGLPAPLFSLLFPLQSLLGALHHHKFFPLTVVNLRSSKTFSFLGCSIQLFIFLFARTTECILQQCRPLTALWLSASPSTMPRHPPQPVPATGDCGLGHWAGGTSGPDTTTLHLPSAPTGRQFSV